MVNENTMPSCEIKQEMIYLKGFFFSESSNPDLVEAEYFYLIRIHSLKNLFRAPVSRLILTVLAYLHIFFHNNATRQKWKRQTLKQIVTEQ